MSQPTDGEEQATQTPQALRGEGIDQDSETTHREQIAEEHATGETGIDAKQTGALRIHVIDGGDNTPVAGVGVIVREVSRYGQIRSPQRFRADAKGEVRVDGLRPGSVSIATDRQRMGFRWAKVIADQETTVVVTMKDGIDLTGIVVDTDGVAVAGASVILGGWAGEDPGSIARTDEDGRFSIRPVPRIVHVAARAKGYAPSPFRMITAGSGAKIDIRVVLPGAGGSVNGQVRDPDGKGVADAVVRLGVKPPYGLQITLPDGTEGMHPPRPETRTDSEGRFNAEGLRPGESPVTVQTKSFAPWTGSVAVVAHTTMPMVIRLSRGAACEGTVRDENGKTLAGLDVRHGAYSSVEYRRTRTALDGSYRLEALPAGRDITVEVRSKEFGNAAKEMRVRAGETLRWDVTLSRGLVLEGRVLGKGGKPLPKTWVSAYGPYVKGRRGWSQAATTDVNGKFELIGCPGGSVVRLDLRAEGYSDLRRTKVDAAAGPLVFRMRFEGESTARILGKLVDPDAKPVSDALIHVGRDGGGGGNVYTTSAKGEIKIEKLRPGLRTVRIRAGAYAGYVSEEHKLVIGETWDLGTVQLVRGGRLRVEFVRPRGAEKERIHLSIYRRGLWLSGFDTRKQVMLSDPLAPDDYELKVSGPKVVSETMPFTIREGEKTELRATAVLGAPRRFELTLPDGTDQIRLLQFSITGSDGFELNRRLRRLPSSMFLLETGLSPGRYSLRAHSENGHKTHLEFEVVDTGVPRTIRLNLK